EKNAVMDKKQQASASAGSSAAENGDEMLEKAMETAIECEVISTSLLQRKLRIGYARAARIVDQLDEMGLIGPSEGGSKPRKFLMTRAQFLEMKARKGESQPSASDADDDDFDIFAD
ncbi:MAG: DNA translocase FtsK, partial [Acutalibacteraceae bacterium]